MFTFMVYNSVQSSHPAHGVDIEYSPFIHARAITKSTKEASSLTTIPLDGISWNLPVGFRKDNITHMDNYDTINNGPPYATRQHMETLSEATSRRFITPPGPVTALPSYPGSGNTWIRHMLEQLTGE